MPLPSSNDDGRSRIGIRFPSLTHGVPFSSVRLTRFALCTFPRISPYCLGFSSPAAVFSPTVSTLPAFLSELVLLPFIPPSYLGLPRRLILVLFCRSRIFAVFQSPCLSQVEAYVSFLQPGCSFQCGIPIRSASEASSGPLFSSRREHGGKLLIFFPSTRSSRGSPPRTRRHRF